MAEGTTIATVLETLTSVVTSIVGIAGQVVEFVTDNPLMLAGVFIPVAAAFLPKGISLLKRAFGKKRI